MINKAAIRSGLATLGLAGAIVLGLGGCAEMDSAPGATHGEGLDKVYWRLVTVDGAAVPDANGRHKPHIEFDSEKKRVMGYSGVNIFSGGYDATGSHLRMSQMASTRRAGPPDLMRFETTYLKALSATRSYRISGNALELLNLKGQVVARFEGQQKP